MKARARARLQVVSLVGALVLSPGAPAVASQDGSGYGVFGQRYDGGGTAQGGEFRANTYTPSDQLNAAVAGAGSGFVVVWDGLNQDGTNRGVFGQRYDGAGSAQGSEFQVNTSPIPAPYSLDYPGTYPKVAGDPNGDFVVVWASYGNFGQRFDATGTPQGGEFAVSFAADIAADAAGNFVVVGVKNDGSQTGVSGQRYDSAGALLGAEFQANTYTSGPQNQPEVGMDAAGNFVVVWRSRDQDGDAFGIFARRYDSGGNPQGAEFQVNTYTTGQQRAPDVAVDPNGDVVIAWRDAEQKLILGQRYDSAGTAQGSNFAVTTGGGNPHVAAAPAGDFVVSWARGSYSYFGTYAYTVEANVFARRFDAAGAAQGAEVQVNTYTIGDQVYPSVAANAAGHFLVVWQSGTDPISGDKILITDNADVTKRKIIFVSKDPAIDTAGGGVGMDPVANGAQLVVLNANTDEEVCFNLGAGTTFWKTSATGTLTYKDPSFTNGPCKSARVKEGKLLKVTCVAKVSPIAFSLDETTQGNMAVRFSSGTTEYCAAFGGTIVKDLQGKKFLAKKAPAASGCAVFSIGASCP
jgi:hypothetical protein